MKWAEIAKEESNANYPTKHNQVKQFLHLSVPLYRLTLKINRQ
jgi:hypothetical protein